MEFTRRKLLEEASHKFTSFRIDSVKPFELMPAPVYLFLKENGKFISVKAPLDFFTPQELDRLKAREYFYFPEFIHSLEFFVRAGEEVQKVLTLGPGRVEDIDENGTPTVNLPPASYEVSDWILHTVGPLWWEQAGKRPGVEPFLIFVFVNTFCDPLPAQMLLDARENSVDSLDRAALRSAWAVFLGLHLGYCSLKFLNDLRVRVFAENAEGKPLQSSLDQAVSGSEVDELILLSYKSFSDIKTRIIYADWFRNQTETLAQKLWGRLERVRREFLSKGNEPPSILGKKGFTDA